MKILLTIAFFFTLVEVEDNCKGFIEQRCCCTNNCCFEIPYTEIQPVDAEGDRWYIRETGETVQRTDWSKDGKAYRCACRLENGKWIVDKKDRTRCLYPITVEAGT